MKLKSPLSNVNRKQLHLKLQGTRNVSLNFRTVLEQSLTFFVSSSHYYNYIKYIVFNVNMRLIFLVFMYYCVVKANE